MVPVIAMVLCVAIGYLIKTDIMKDKRLDIVKTILLDVKEHDIEDWSTIDQSLEDILILKWSEILKRGVPGYYKHIESVLGRKPTRIGEE